MKAMRVSITLDEFNSYIKSKLSESDLVEFQDCTWAPLKLEFNTEIMIIDAFIVPVKD